MNYTTPADCQAPRSLPYAMMSGHSRRVGSRVPPYHDFEKWGIRARPVHELSSRFELELPRRPSSLILSHDRFSAIVADQIERNSERDNVLEEKQAKVVHVMDAVDHDRVIRSRDQHGARGEEHAD